MPSLSSYQHEKHIETTYTSVYLQEAPTMLIPEIYYCPRCRYAVLQYQGDIVQELPGGAPVKLPIIVQCRNKDCGRKYYFVAIVKQ